MTSQNVIFAPGKDRLERTIGSYADGVVYAVYAIENPKRRQSLDDLIREFGKAGLNYKRVLDDGRIRGKEYTLQRDDITGVTRFYLTEHHVYIFESAGSSLGDAERGIPKFLDSIRFGKDPDGQKVVDGIGAQPTHAPLTAAEIFSGKVVARKAVVVTKPEPAYTEQARKNVITGTVVIRCVFSSYGTITNVHVISGLPDGLNERSTNAARQIRFVPAIKDGHFVSMWMELQYNFNLY
jgi:TonB family protein